MNDDPIDLSPLDPMRNRQKWQSRIDQIVADAVHARRQPTLLDLVEHYARPALAVAAAAALISWVNTLRESNPSASASSEDPTTSILNWARDGKVPATSEVFQSLGVQNVGP